MVSHTASQVYDQCLFLIHMALQNPPWTFINLGMYFCLPTFFKRGSYASFWSTLLSFHLINIIDGTAHSRLASKQGISLPAFYAFDFIVHWCPIYFLYVPPLKKNDMASKLFSLTCNISWGAWISRGTMNLSQVYIELEFYKWCILWLSVCCITPNIYF